MSTERQATQLHQDIAAETRTLQDQELDAVSGGFVIYGSQALGGPDTNVWTGADLLRSKSLDRN